MPSRVAVQTPIEDSPAIELGGGLWRKKILPVGWLDYPEEGGRTRRLEFTPDYLRNVVTAFKARAFDQVPFQLADAKNAHTNDPERGRGEVVGLDADDRGLYATVRADERGDKLLAANPNLGVSVRVLEGYTRQDGRSAHTHPAALQHLLGTWAPRIAGMGPWERAVSCAEPDEDLIDLSALTFAANGQGAHQTTATNGGEEGEGPMAPTTLTETERAALAALPGLLAKLAGGDGASAPTTPVAPTAPVAGPTQAPPAPVAPVADTTTEDDDEDDTEFTEDELKAMAGAAPPVTTLPDRPQPIAAAVGDGAVELAVVQTELAHVRDELAAARWAREADELTRRLGIPPAIVNLAAPVLRGTGNAIELAHGEPSEPARQAREQAGAVMRQVLAAVGKTYGRLVDLSGPVGSAQDHDQASTEAASRDQFLKDVRASGFSY